MGPSDLRGNIDGDWRRDQDHEELGPPLIIEGRGGNMAIARLFVVPSGFTLWGRVVLSQWGTCLEISAENWGF